MTHVEPPLFDTPDTPSGPPMVSQAEAARLCRVSTATIRRRRMSGDLADCVQAPDGRGWLIPIPSLVAAGLLDRVTPPDTVTTRRVSPDTTPPSGTPVSPPDTPTCDEVEVLRERLRAAEHRAQLAEAIAAERAAALEDARRALRLLEAGPSHESAQREFEKQESAEQSPPRGWFRRLFG